MERIMPPALPDRQPGEPWTADSLARELIWLEWVDDAWGDRMHRRLIALEEALVSRKARRRLRREIRESAERFAWVGESFYGRRLEDVFNQHLCRDERAA